MPEVKAVSVKISVSGAEDAKLKIDDLAVKAEELKKLNPTITPNIDAAKALIEARVLRAGLKAEFEKSITETIDVRESALSKVAGADATGSGLTGLLTPMSGLIAAAVALSPVIITAGIGLAGFGAAAFKSIDPVIKAAQATGGLTANMGKLNPEQQSVARGFLSLDASFSQFSKSLQPQVFSVLRDSLGVVKTLMTEVQPVAKAAGSALDTVVKDIGKGLQDSEWKQFFSWMAATAGPDILMVGKAVGSLLNDLPPLLESLQPVAGSLLKLVTVGAQAANVLGEIDGASAAATVSMGSFGTAVDAVAGAPGGHSSFISFIKQGLQGLNLLSLGLTPVAKNAQKAGGSIQSMGNQAQTAAAQVTALYGALHKLLDPLTQNIQDAVTFKDDQVALSQALKKSHDALGLHTAAQRASASAAAQAAQDALTLSQNILTQTGNARKAAGPLESLAGELKKTGDKGGYAAGLIRELEAAIAALRSKTVDVTVITRSSELPQGTVGNAKPHAAGGPASGLIRVGELGPELLQVPSGSYVYNHQQTQQMLGGGATYNINVGVLPGNEREAGRVIVQAIRKFEQGSGSSWRN